MTEFWLHFHKHRAEAEGANQGHKCPRKNPVEVMPPSSLISPNELKELRRVFDTLCQYANKHPRSRSTKRLSGDDDGTVQSTNTTTSGLSIMSGMSSLSEPYIRAQDIAAALRDLGKKVTKQEVQTMLWEADEKNDGVIDWDEMTLMFERNLRDSSGLEPAGLYHVVQFMIFDRNANGKVSIDETMNILYARLGREKMEASINLLFSDDGAPVEERGCQGGEITFERFSSVARSEQTRAFQESEMGKLLKERKTK